MRASTNRLRSGLIILVTALLSGCGGKPNLAPKSVIRGNDLEFRFRTNELIGLISVRVWVADSKILIWDLNLDYYKDSSLDYGKVPKEFKTFNGRISNAVQIFPNEGIPPKPLLPGKDYFVNIEFLYDSAFGESVSSASYLFKRARETDAGSFVRVFEPPPKVQK